MTTLSDYLNDFTEDIKKIVEDLDKKLVPPKGQILPKTLSTWEQKKQDKIDELLKIIIERLIGD